jgi:uncharacterized protein YdaU (DUF1376 family)
MKYPWMPLFNGDLLANTLHLSAQEFGAYMLLIIHAWEFGGKIKVAEARRIARIGNRHWATVRDRLAPFFDPPDGLQGLTLEVSHSRVAKELANAAELSNKRKGAAVQMHRNRRASAPVLQVVCTTPSPSQSLDLKRGQPKVESKQAYKPGGMSPSKGDDYRSPPPIRPEHAHKLQPLPDKR